MSLITPVAEVFVGAVPFVASGVDLVKGETIPWFNEVSPMERALTVAKRLVLLERAVSRRASLAVLAGGY